MTKLTLIEEYHDNDNSRHRYYENENKLGQVECREWWIDGKLFLANNFNPCKTHEAYQSCRASGANNVSIYDGEKCQGEWHTWGNSGIMFNTDHYICGKKIVAETFIKL